MLHTPQALESQLPGEAHLYRCKHGYIFYKLLGASDAQPLVLLHSPGIAASGYEMRGIMESLAKRFRVYTPDLPGFGLSDRPRLQYTAELYIQICTDFLANVVGQPALLVASRLSCNYAIAVAARSPELCSGLILISPADLHGGSSFRLIPPAFFESKLTKMLLYPLFVLVSYNGTRGTYYYATTHRFGAEHAVMALLAGRLNQDVSREIEEVRQPALVIWGVDALGKLQRARFTREGLQAAWALKQAQIELLPEGGLSAHEEQPRRIAEMILHWSANQVLAVPHASTSGDRGISNQNSSDVEKQNAALPRTQAASAQVEAYCTKCKTKRPVLNAREVTMKNGRLAVQGACAVCGTQLFRLGRLAPGYPNTPV
jgi:pimeloyl-ACP methyl ester carboxylesterase